MNQITYQVAYALLLLQMLSGCRVFLSTSQTKSDLDPDIVAVYNTCITCHKIDKHSAHEDLKNIDDLQVYTAWLGSEQFDYMLGLTRVDDEKKTKFRSYYESIKPKVAAHSNTALRSCIQQSENKQIQAEQVDQESSPLADNFFQGVKGNSLVYYSNQSVPRVWQHASIVNSSQSSEPYLIDEENQVNSYTTEYQKSIYEALGYYSDGPMEFPWKHSAGLDLSQELRSLKFVLPPREGKLLDIKKRDADNSPEYFDVKVSDIKGPQVGWEYQEGTMFGEMIYKDEQIFEVRLRMLVKKTAEKSYWKMDVLRYFSNQAELEVEIEGYCKENSSEAACSQNKSKKEAQTLRLSDILTSEQITSIEKYPSSEASHSPFSHSTLASTALKPEVQVANVDHVSAALYQKLISGKKLKSVFGKAWTSTLTDPQASWAPFSSNSDSFVGKNYLGPFLKLSLSSCMGCHSTAGKHVDGFDPPKDSTTLKPAAMDVQSRSRTWYNFLQGNDTVFSFHPFSNEAMGGKMKITSNGQINSAAINSCISGGLDSGTVPNTPQQKPTVSGESVWSSNCSVCHSVQKSSSQFKALMSDPARKSQMDSQMMRGALSRLTSEEIDALGDYLP